MEARHSRRILGPLILLCLMCHAAPARAEFVRGFYTLGEETFDTVVSLGFNLVICPTDTWDLEGARRRGLGLIPAWFGDDETSYAKIRALDTEPVIRAWYPFDEPDIYGYSSDVVESKVAWLRRHSTKPVFLTVWTPQEYTTYLPHADIFGITPYPIGSHPGEVKMEITARYAAYARSLCDVKPLYVCIPVFFQRPWQYRAPDRHELHNIVYQALTAGPDGLLFFIWMVGGLDGVVWKLEEHPDLLEEIARINRELIDLDAVLERGTTADALLATVAPAEVPNRIVEHEGDLYWIAANPSRNQVMLRATFREPIGEARLLHGGRSTLGVSAADRRVSLNLGRLGYAAVRIGRPANSRPEVPTRPISGR